MKNQKGIFPPQRDPARGGTTLLVGIIIIIAVVIIAFGGVFGYQYFAAQQANNQPQVQSQRQNQNTENLTEEITSQPSITVTSPNGGEQWVVGSTHNITWQASGFQGNNINVWLTAVDYSDHSGRYPNKQYSINVLPNGSNGGLPITQGSYSWTIPYNFVNSSQMKVNISVSSSISNEDISSESNNYFSIVVLTTAQPSISYISPNPASVGSTVTVTGANLSGFEADKNLWIENSAGQKGIIYGTSGSTDSMIKFMLANNYCTADTSYSGLPCSSYITITPGTYNIYALPWGNMSNKMPFSVVL